jgi:hypothetical protein
MGGGFNQRFKVVPFAVKVDLYLRSYLAEELQDVGKLRGSTRRKRCSQSGNNWSHVENSKGQYQPAKA